MSAFTPDRLAVVSLPAGDVTASLHFYRDIMGLPLLTHHDHLPAFDLGHGCHLVIVHGRPASARGPGRTHFPVLAFAVGDLAEAVEHLERHDVVLPWGVEAGPAARWVKFYDPAGNLIEIAQFDEPSFS